MAFGLIRFFFLFRDFFLACWLLNTLWDGSKGFGGIVAAFCCLLFFAYIIPSNAANTPAKARLLRHSLCRLLVCLLAFPHVSLEFSLLVYCFAFIFLSSHFTSLFLSVPDAGQDSAAC
ncbi:hypothetical protein IWX91DRAFT_146706 [Phyllosticta citricarpa]